MKKLLSLVLVLAMVFAMGIPVSAASTSQTVTTTGTMSIYLDPSASGSSSIVNFSFTSLPANAVVTKLVVDASSNISNSGLGAILSERVYVQNSTTMEGWASAAWGTGNKTEVTGAFNMFAKGTWQVYFTGTNVASYSPATNYSATKTYKSVKVTITYNY